MTRPERKPSAVSTAATSPHLHPRNRHQGRYDFDALIAACPDLAGFVRLNPHGERSIDFAEPRAVKALNRALLQSQYGIAGWDIPAGYLCPPIPGRADYIHGLADLLMQSNGVRLPQGDRVRVLDIGTGANLVYPLIGRAEYRWTFVAADIDAVALDNARRILDANPGWAESIELRLQRNSETVFHGMIEADARYDLTICNPPFHASLEEADAGSRRKWNNLGKPAHKSQQPALNFGGQAGELSCPGGEAAFVVRMIEESKRHAHQCFWFTTLISKAGNLPLVLRTLRRVGARQVSTIEMAQGQKQSRFVAWTFLNETQQNDWRAARWAT